MRIKRSYVLLLACSLPVAQACSHSSTGSSTSGTGGLTGATTTAASGSGGSGNAATNTTGAFGTGGASGCGNGQPCKGGTCVNGACCAAAHVCGTACCSGSDVCSFQTCVTPGANCRDSSDCAPSEYCEYTIAGLGASSSSTTSASTASSSSSSTSASTGSAGCMGSVTPMGKCLPRPPTCSQGGPGPGDPTCLEMCEYHPVGTFNPVLKASWGGQLTAPFSTDVMMAPVVMALEDTNCDGKVDANDVPDILFTSFTGGNYQSNGTLHAIRMEGGNLVDKWSATGIAPGASLAAANIDGLPGNEVVACGDGGKTLAFKADGTLLWSAPYSCYMPSIADIDGDGKVEVIVEGGILDGATGTLKHAFTPALDAHFIVSDLDGDGQLDVITADRAYHADGTLFVDTKLGGDWPAIADFDHDGKPEVVLVDTAAHSLSLWRYDATQPSKFKVVRAAVDMNAGFPTNHCPMGSYGYSHGGGPPTVADFNGDGIPDVGLAGGIGYVVFDGAKLLDPTATAAQTILWSTATTDCSSAQTGSSVFDFQGSGLAQVVYSDEEYLRIYDGKNGNVLFKTCNTTGTLVELPIVADVDNDGHADIVVVSNAYASGNAEYQCNDGTHIAQAGVRVFGDANGTWVRTPSVWNEHAYHVTNIAPDGTVPQHEPPNFTQPGLDDFRQNKGPGVFFAPDLVVSVAPSCPMVQSLIATVRNIGQAAVPAGVVVGFYEGMPPSGTLLGQATTTYPIYPAEAAQIVLPLVNPDAGLTSGHTPVYAVVDDGMPSHPSWHECRTDNNTSAPVAAICVTPQ